MEDIPATTIAPEPVPPTVEPAAVVGLIVDEATTTLAERGLTLRVVREDGVELPVTADFSETRATSPSSPPPSPQSSPSADSEEHAASSYDVWDEPCPATVSTLSTLIRPRSATTQIRPTPNRVLPANT